MQCRTCWSDAATCLASFWLIISRNVTSLMKYYGSDPRTIVKCLDLWDVTGAGAYSVWLLGTMGNIPRPNYRHCAERRRNIGCAWYRRGAWCEISRSLIRCWCLFTLRSPAPSFGVTLGRGLSGGSVLVLMTRQWGVFKTALPTSPPPMTVRPAVPGIVVFCNAPLLVQV